MKKEFKIISVLLIILISVQVYNTYHIEKLKELTEMHSARIIVQKLRNDIHENVLRYLLEKIK